MNAHITLSIAVRLLEEVDRLAKEAERTRSEVIRQYVQEGVARSAAIPAKRSEVQP